MNNPDLIKLGIGLLIALQTWTLKEVYSLRITLTRHDERISQLERTNRS